MKKILLFTAVLLLGLTAHSKNEYENPTDPNVTDEGVVINGVRWATRNVDMPGTFADNPEDAGMFYQWNSKEAWSGNIPNPEQEFILVVLGGDPCLGECPKWEEENDPCPPGWRVPTREELRQLARAFHTWTTVNGVNGMLFRRASYQVFLPAAGSVARNDGWILGAGTNGNYWSNIQSDSKLAYRLFFGERENAWLTGEYHKDGLSIRCVAKNK